MSELVPLEAADLRSRGLDLNTLAPCPTGIHFPWVHKETGEVFFLVGKGAPGHDFNATYVRIDEWEKKHKKPHPSMRLVRAIMKRCRANKAQRSSLRKYKPPSFIEEERRSRPRVSKQTKKPRSVLDSPVIIDGAQATESMRQKVRAADEQLTKDRGGKQTEAGEAALEAALESKDAPLTALFDPNEQKAVALREDALASSDHKEALVELTSPERVVETLRQLKFGDAEHVAALVGIIRDIGSHDKDRISALSELREIIKETSVALGVSVGEVKRAITTGDWNLIAERTLAEKVAAGDIEAIKMAIFSNKISSLKAPTKDPSVAVLTINGAQVELTAEQQERLSRLDDLLVLPEERNARKVVKSRIVDGDESEMLEPEMKHQEPLTEGTNDERTAE